MNLLKTKTKLLASTIALSIGYTSISHALFLNPTRCGHDQLEPAQAAGRNQWFKKCSPLQYKAYFPAGAEFGAVASTNAPQYPTYAKTNGYRPDGSIIFEITGWRAPISAPPSQTDPACLVPEPNELIGLCTASCATGDTELLSAQGTKPFVKMYEEKNEEILSPEITQDGQIELRLKKLNGYTRDMMDSSQEIFKIVTENGAILKTSSHHPLLTSERVMVRSKDIKVGQFLLTAKGTPTKVISVEKEMFFGKLYNATVDTNDKQKSLYVINNVISGDKKIQDEIVSDINRSIFRDIVNKEK